MAEKRYIAVDLGAESGRVMLAAVSQAKIRLEEIHRFENGPVTRGMALKWDFAKLFGAIKEGLGKAIQQTGGDVCGIAVDSWGVDYGFIGADGKLLDEPFHYRDARTATAMDYAYSIMPKREIYENSGLQFMQFNTLYQLVAEKAAGSAAMAQATSMICMADLVAYNLCGNAYAEYTLASTTQLMDMRNGTWSKAIMEKLGLPIQILPKIVQAGTVVGTLTPAMQKELGAGAIPVIAVASHDTGSAVAAVPAKGEKWAYISSGTWSLMGVEIPRAIINDTTFKHEFTNEGGVYGTIRLLKNIMGLWIVQECRRQWQREGQEFSYEQIARMAGDAKPFAAAIDVNYGDFFGPGNMPEKINGYLAKMGQAAINDKGQLVRVVLESLAFEYRRVMDMIEDVTGSKIETLHIVGGGSKNELLCQFAADILNKRVLAGPVEATALGNIMVQAIATGQLKSVQQGRELVKASAEMKEYRPENAKRWDEEYKKFKARL